MAKSLIKNQRVPVNYTGSQGQTVEPAVISLGCGWDTGIHAIDLDISGLLFTKGGELVDRVSYKQLRSKDAQTAVFHSGDNTTGVGDGDDERLFLYLREFPQNVDSLFLTINSFSGQAFNRVENAYARLLDVTAAAALEDLRKFAGNRQKLLGLNGTEVYRYSLSDMKGDSTALIIVRFYRHEDGKFRLQALGEPGYAQTADQLVSQIKKTYF